MRLDVLPRGISGFWPAGEEPLPTADRAAFKVACYEAARACQGEVVRFDAGQSVRSYHAVSLKVGPDDLRVVCNNVLPFIAFASGPAESLQLVFVDNAILRSAFERITSFQVLDADWLNQSADKQVTSSLSDAELQQFSYWRKLGMDRIGDVIFNVWD